MRKYYIKVITGFREDQFVSIPMQEAHKAYYLFRHPDERGVFENGTALIGRNIQEIKPDWSATMGWKPTHQLDSFDWDEINGNGVADKMRQLQQQAQDVAEIVNENKNLLKTKLQECLPILEDIKLLLVDVR